MMLRQHEWILRRNGFGVDGADRILSGKLILPRFQPIDYSDIDSIWTMQVDPLSTFEAYLYGLELLCTLANAYEKQPKEEYLTFGIRIINSYVRFRRNDPREIAEFSISTGLVNIIHILHLMDEAGLSFSAEEWTQIQAFLRKDADFLCNDEHYKYSNHGIWQDLALIELCLVSDLTDCEDRFLSTALRRITNQIHNNFTSEYINVENSPFYHYYNLTLYQNVLDILNQNTVIRTYVEQNAEFNRAFDLVNHLLTDGKDVLYHMLRPDATLPCIGDSEGIKINRFKKNVASDSVVYPKTGLAYFRCKDSFAAFKSGVRYTGHKHYDDCSFVFDYLGVPTLIDAGKLTYEYNERTAVMHSVLGHNGVSRVGKNYKIKRDVNKYVLPEALDQAGISAWETAEAYDYAVGYNYFYHEDSIERHFLFVKPNLLILVDNIYDPAAVFYIQNFNFGVDFVPKDGQKPTTEGADFVHPASGVEVTLRQHRQTDGVATEFGNEATHVGLSSVSFGELLHNYNVQYKLRCPPAQNRFITTLQAHESMHGADECHLQEVTCVNNLLTVTYYQSGHDCRIELRLNQKQVKHQVL